MRNVIGEKCQQWRNVILGEKLWGELSWGEVLKGEKSSVEKHRGTSVYSNVI